MKKISPTPPIEDEKIKTGNPKTTAAGIPAVVSSVKHVLNEMTMGNCVKTLFAVNQMALTDTVTVVPSKSLTQEP